MKLLAHVRETCFLSPPRYRHLDETDALEWTDSKLEKVTRSLYGVLGVSEEHFYSRRVGRRVVGYAGFSIPHQNYEAVYAALESGRFEKEVEPADVDVLHVIYERDAELRKGRPRWNPRFHLSEVSKRSRKSSRAVRESIQRLTGVLAETHFREKVKGKPCMTGKTRWFLPTARLSDAERVLELYA